MTAMVRYHKPERSATMLGFRGYVMDVVSRHVSEMSTPERLPLALVVRKQLASLSPRETGTRPANRNVFDVPAKEM